MSEPRGTPETPLEAVQVPKEYKVSTGAVNNQGEEREPEAGRGAAVRPDGAGARTYGTLSAQPHPFDPLAALRAPGDPACDVYLAGTVFLDIIFTGLDSAPVRGTESWARGMGSSPGGVANMATALARLGLHTSLAAAFGDDMYGDYCREALDKGEGIDLALSHTVPGWHSPVTVSMAYEGERTMISHGHEAPPREPTASPTALGLGRAPIDPEAPGCPPPARACVTSLAPGDGQEWIAIAARHGSRIFADVGWDDTGRWDLGALPDLEHCEAFLPNAEEAMRYTRTDCPRAAARALSERVPLAVVTLGAQGSCAVDGRTGESAEVPGIPVDALDTTGAGDVFVAGFVMGSLAGWPLADRLAFAGLTAALSVQEFGGSLSAPGWSEIAAWWSRVRAGGPRAGAAGGAGAQQADGPCEGTYGFLDAVLTGCPGSAPRRRALPTIGFGRTTGAR
ncbi:carbohydrate kinase family protein [Streptomyces bathyalis]|uniref:carbohydrate kinase family protein n=1 Tax=Streptomyces bathyalis TaxID=2710756 RepID=UPI001FE3B0A5|nr:PfkB family carbohydrate kinase [Streptomyces bathyalis]